MANGKVTLADDLESRAQTIAFGCGVKCGNSRTRRLCSRCLSRLFAVFLQATNALRALPDGALKEG